LDPRHPVVLAGLHLGRRPVDRVDLGLGADGAEEVVGRAPVVLEELVALDVADDVAIPARGLLPVEVPAHDEAAPPAQPRQCRGGHRAGLDVGVVDDGPDRLAPFPRGGDLVDLGLDLPFDDGEDLLDGAARRGDAGAQRRLDLPDRGGQVRGRLLPVRQGGERGGSGRG
jgi:hypothetical protein